MELYEHRIVDACETLHMHFMGTSDPLSEDKVIELVGFLKMRLHYWHSSISSSKYYDDAIKHLIRATLKEYDTYVRKQISRSAEQNVKVLNDEVVLTDTDAHSLSRTYPSSPAAKKLDEIIQEQKLNKHSITKINSIIDTSFVLFKDIACIDSKNRATLLSWAYEKRCRAVDETKYSEIVKEHIKSIIYSGCRKYIPGSKTYEY